MLIRYMCTACNCVCLGGKWSGEWQISRNFGACGAAGKFFSKFRETLANPNQAIIALKSLIMALERSQSPTDPSVRRGITLFGVPQTYLLLFSPGGAGHTRNFLPAPRCLFVGVFLHVSFLANRSLMAKTKGYSPCCPCALPRRVRKPWFACPSS
jgi:hypothetical protein